MDRPNLQVASVQQNAASMSGCQGGVLDLTALYGTVRSMILYINELLVYLAIHCKRTRPRRHSFQQYHNTMSIVVIE